MPACIYHAGASVLVPELRTKPLPSSPHCSMQQSFPQSRHRLSVSYISGS